MTQTDETNKTWALIDWAFLRPDRIDEDQQRFSAVRARAATLAPPERIVYVLREQDRPWWARDLSGHPKPHIIEQPFDRGSATSVFVGALHIERHEPKAEVWFLGRVGGHMPVVELLETYRRNTPDLYRSSAASLRRAADRPSVLDQVYPFLACLELDAVLGS